MQITNTEENKCDSQCYFDIMYGELTNQLHGAESLRSQQSLS